MILYGMNFWIEDTYQNSFLIQITAEDGKGIWWRSNTLTELSGYCSVTERGLQTENYNV